MCYMGRVITDKTVDLTKRGTLFIREILQGKKEEGAAFDFVSAPKEKHHTENSKACPAA